MRYQFVALAMLIFLVTACGAEQPPQEPFSGRELVKFIKDGTAVNRETKTLRTTPEGSQLSRAALQREVYARLQKRDWNVRRFYYIYGQCFQYTEYILFQKESDELEFSAEGMPSNMKNEKVKKFLANQSRAMQAMREQVDKDVPVSEQIYIRERFRAIRSFLTSSVIFFPPD